MKPLAKSGSVGFRLIGALKLSSGLLGLALGFGLLKLIHRDLAPALEHVLQFVRLDPDRRIFRTAISWVAGIPHHDLRLIEFATFFYATLHCTEGTGLLLRKTWAEYLTVIATSALVPLELYALTRRVSLVKIVALAVNLLIVAYLVDQLRRARRAPQAPAAPEPQPEIPDDTTGMHPGDPGGQASQGPDI